LTRISCLAWSREYTCPERLEAQEVSKPVLAIRKRQRMSNVLLWRIVSSCLTKLGYQIWQTDSVAHGCELVQEEPMRFDLILTEDGPLNSPDTLCQTVAQGLPKGDPVERFWYDPAHGVV